MPSAKPDELSISALKSNLLDLTADHKEMMGPYLYWLRAKLKAQGARNDLKNKREGFGPWVEANLHITRKTADTWANDWAIENGLMEKSTSGKSSKGSGGGSEEFDEVPGERPEYFSMSMSLTPSEQEAFILAWTDLGEEHATKLVFETVVEAAKAQEGTPKTELFNLGELPPKKEPATVLESLDQMKANESPKKRLTFLDEEVR
jgi:hypothetical protein